MTEENLRGILNCSTASIDELLQEDLAKDAIRLFAEDGAEDDSDSVVTGLDVDGLLFTVVNGSDLTSLLNTLGRSLRGVLGGFFVESGVFVKGLFEGGSHGVALQQAESGNEVVASILLGGEVLEVDFYGKVVALLGRDNVGAVFTLEDVLGAILDQLLEAFDVDGDEDLCLGGRSRDVEGDAIKVGDDLVN